MKTAHPHEVIKLGEGLQVEFKSDLKPLSDRELVAAIVSLANTEGGDLFLGVEDDGRISGLSPSHCDTRGVEALIANKTRPPLSVQVESVIIEGKEISCIHVAKSPHIVSTSDGLLQRRRLMANGKPEAVPFYSHEITQRQAVLGLIDPSARPLLDLSVECLNSVERQRVRDAIQSYGGDKTLLALEDSEFDGALGVTTMVEGVRSLIQAVLLKE